MAIDPPFYPIVYVRGYAMRPRDIENTVGTPYLGFNLGSTKIRQRAGGDIERLIFESPLVRLMKDYGYRDTYRDGGEAGPDELPERPIFIYRYYDQGSQAFGDGQRREIEEYAEGLDRLIGRVRDDLEEPAETFGVYLVAHSMGGVICRAFLQNHNLGGQRNRRSVKKVFTYATPHNGIDVRVVGNLLPSFWNANNFRRKRMKEYLAISNDADANSLDGKFDPRRFFSLVGTNYKDYGLRRAAVPEDSDGLVRIRNAFVQGGPRAFVHRSHSGPLGIVNSEEGYQILRRFLFGDLQVDGRLRCTRVQLPASVEMRKVKEKVAASYHFETVVGVRGARGWDMGRRTIRERCAVFRSYDALKGAEDAGPGSSKPRLFTVFLAKKLRTKSSEKEQHDSTAFVVRVRIPVPDYELGGRVRSNEHFEGSVLFQDVLVVKIGAAETGESPWKVTYGWSADGAGSAPHRAAFESGRGDDDDGCWRFVVPVENAAEPNFSAELELTVQSWRGT